MATERGANAGDKRVDSRDKARKGARSGASQQGADAEWGRGFTATRWSPSSLARADQRASVERARQSAQRDPAAVRADLGEGAPLPGPARQALELDLGYDLSPVRIHEGSAARTAAATLGAKALTIGSSIAFGAGRFQPNTPTGNKLLRHEVSHVIQQAGGSASLGLSRPTSVRESGLGPAAQEQQADTVAHGRSSAWWHGAVGGPAAAPAQTSRLMPLRGIQDVAVQLASEDHLGDDGAGRDARKAGPDDQKKPGEDKEAGEGAPREYTVREGDTLRAIAQRLLGDPERFQEIQALNPQVTDPDHVEPGMVLKIPAARPQGADVAPGAQGPDAGGPKPGGDAKGDGAKADGAKGDGDDQKKDEPQEDAGGPGARVDGPKEEAPAPDQAPPGPVNLPKVEAKANDQVKAWLRAHPDPVRGPRIEALGTVTDRIFASSQALAINMPVKTTGWHGLDEKIGGFLKDFRDVPFKGKNLTTIQKTLNILHQVGVAIDKSSGIVGTIGTVATVGGAILTLLAPPVGAFLLAAGRLANVISLALASAKLVLSVVQTALNAIQIAKEKDPEKLAELVGQMQANIESGLMAGLDVVMSKTGAKGAAEKATGGLKGALNLKGIKKAFEKGGIGGAMKAGAKQVGSGIADSVSGGLKGLKQGIKDLPKNLKGGVIMKEMREAGEAGLRGNLVKPFADIRHATKDLGMAFKGMTQNTNIKSFFQRDYWRQTFAQNFPSLKAVSEARIKQKARDGAVKDLRKALKTEADPAKQAEMFKKLATLKNDKATQTLSRQSKVGAIFGDLTDSKRGGFAANVSEHLYGRTEYDARASSVIAAERHAGIKAKAAAEARAEMRAAGVDPKTDLAELRRRRDAKIQEKYQGDHGKKVERARDAAFQVNPDVHSPAFEQKFKAEMERLYADEAARRRIQRNIHFSGTPGNAKKEITGAHTHHVTDPSPRERLAAAAQRDFKSAMEDGSELSGAFLQMPDMLGLKPEFMAKKGREAKGKETAAGDGASAAVADEVAGFVSNVQQAAQSHGAISAEHQLEAMILNALHAMNTGPAPAPQVAAGAPAVQAPAVEPLPAFGPGTPEQLEDLEDQLKTLGEVEAQARQHLTQSEQDKTEFLKDKQKVTAAKAAATAASLSAKAKHTQSIQAGADIDKGMAGAQKSDKGLTDLSGNVNNKANDASGLSKKDVSVKPANPPKPPEKEESGFFGSVWGGIKKAATWVKDQAMKAVNAAINTVMSAINKVKTYFTDLITQMVFSIVKKAVGEAQGARIDAALLLNKKKKMAAASAALAETQTQAEAAKIKAASTETALDRRIAQADKNAKDAQALLGEVATHKAAITAERDGLKAGIEAFTAAHGAKIAQEGAPTIGPAPAAGGVAGPAPRQPVPVQTLGILGQAADLVDRESTRSEGVVDAEADKATANMTGALGKLPAGQVEGLRKRASDTGATAKSDHKAAQARRRTQVANLRVRITALAGKPADQEVAAVSADLKAALGGVQADRNAALNGMYNAFTFIADDVKALSSDVGDGLFGDDAEKAMRGPDSAGAQAP